jgi:hypothetical protein
MMCHNNSTASERVRDVFVEKFPRNDLGREFFLSIVIQVNNKKSRHKTF